ncbi:hypothetical protein FBU30_002650, partial [Linnemannia zychae]
MTAQLGYMHAQNQIGEVFREGYSVQKDYQAAMDRFLKAAAHGLPWVQFSVDDMHDYARGVLVNFIEALKWFRKAVTRAMRKLRHLSDNCMSMDMMRVADQGIMKVQRQVGYMYRKNLGVPQAYAQAMMWYQKVAAQNDTTVMGDISFSYYQGDGVLQDYSKAMEWFREAAEQGKASAQE